MASSSESSTNITTSTPPSKSRRLKRMRDEYYSQLQQMVTKKQREISLSASSQWSEIPPPSLVLLATVASETARSPLIPCPPSPPTASAPSPPMTSKPSSPIDSTPLPLIASPPIASMPSPLIASTLSPPLASSPSPPITLKPSPTIDSTPLPLIASPPIDSTPSPLIASIPSPPMASAPSPPTASQGSGVRETTPPITSTPGLFPRKKGPGFKATRRPTATPTSWTGSRCTKTFFDTSCKELAKKLLGCTLFRLFEGELIGGRVVETEAYLGGNDKAAHSHTGKRTAKNEAMYMPPGTAYVYAVYGLHHCFNISSRGDGAAVLIRALEPTEGLAGIKERRKGVKRKKELCNGPAKLCKALCIDKTCDKMDLVSSQSLWVEFPTKEEEFEVVESKRVNVQYAGEVWANKLLRFYIKGSPHISRK